MMSAKSDMNFEIVKRFREAGVEIPFAQRDVYIKNLDTLMGAGKADPKALDLEPGQPLTSAAMDMETGSEGEPTT